MARQSYVGAAGDSTHAFTVVPVIETAIDRLSRINCIFGGLGMDTAGREKLVKTKTVNNTEYDVATTAAIQIADIDKGDEKRFSLLDDFDGLPTHGAYPVQEGEYPLLYHDKVRLNYFDSPAYPFWSEMDQQRIANLIRNLEPEYQKQIAWYIAEWIDFLAIQALLHMADRGLLLTTLGGLGLQLGNAASAGDALSCKNTYVGGSGWVTWNATRATFEGAIATALDGLTDTTGDHFGVDAHQAIKTEITSNKRFKTVEAFGMKLRAIAIADPWVIERMGRRHSNNTWFTLMRDADTRGPKNHAIDYDQAFVMDKILYIPCEWMRAFRATTSGGLPVYGCGLTGDPKTKLETADSDSKLCGIIYMGARALLHARSRVLYGAGSDQKKGGKIWFTTDPGKHGKGGAMAAHMKVGFKRYEPQTEIGGTAIYLNNATAVAWFYDAGPGVAPAA